MLPYEWLALAYFGGLAITSLLAPEARWRRLMVSAAAIAIGLLVFVIASTGGEWIRAWAPHAYLVFGYWLPGALAHSASHPTRFERWLHRSDEWLRPVARGMPAPLMHVTELAYLVCYPLVPASFLVVWTSGSAADINRFWLAVLVAGYACYVSLPWLVSRPPRLTDRVGSRGEGGSTPAGIAALNVFVLGRVSHQLNTFPSGHVAVSIASAAGVAGVSPLAGALVGTTAAAIAAGAIAGRYHYVIDVVLGAAVAVFAAAVALT